MSITAESHSSPIYSVEEFLSNSAYVDKGYGGELFAAINFLVDLTIYTPTKSIHYYFTGETHPYHRACTYQPLIRDVNDAIENILLSIELSDPKKIVRQYSWWDKFNMRDKQAEAEYFRGVKNIRFHKPLMERNILLLRDALAALRCIQTEMSRALPLLEILIEQGFNFIESQEKEPNPIYEKSLDRFRRQLKNSIAFKSMALMNAKQIEQYIELSQITVDRANEISTILIPIWQSLYQNQSSETAVDMAKIQSVAQLHEKVLVSFRNL